MAFVMAYARWKQIPQELLYKHPLDIVNMLKNDVICEREGCATSAQLSRF